jgi:hypothetical protein
LRQGLGKADRMLDVMIVEIAEALAA